MPAFVPMVEHELHHQEGHMQLPSFAHVLLESLHVLLESLPFDLCRTCVSEHMFLEAGKIESD